MTPGDRFGYLVVLAESSRGTNYGRLYRCLCVCGAESVQRPQDMRSGRVVSCGCIGALGRQAARNASRIKARHEAAARKTALADEQNARAGAVSALYAFAGSHAVALDRRGER